jgi:hypothetical protein
MKSYTKLVLMVAFAVLFVSTFATADTPGAHPAYLHALSTLRAARAHLNVETGSKRGDDSERHAIAEIDSALHELQVAAISDGKSMNDHAPVDAQLSRGDRLHHALDLLWQARQDIDQHESDDFAKGLKHRALQHIDEAWRAIQIAIDPTWHQ